MPALTDTHTKLTKSSFFLSPPRQRLSESVALMLTEEAEKAGTSVTLLGVCLCVCVCVFVCVCAYVCVCVCEYVCRWVEGGLRRAGVSCGHGQCFD